MMTRRSGAALVAGLVGSPAEAEDAAPATAPWTSESAGGEHDAALVSGNAKVREEVSAARSGVSACIELTLSAAQHAKPMGYVLVLDHRPGTAWF